MSQRGSSASEGAAAQHAGYAAFNSMPSPFLLIPETAWVAQNDLAFAVRDRYPVSPGHTLVITKREVPSCFEMTSEELAAVWSLATEVKRALDLEFRPQGYNVGFNAGEAAGQTVMHVHLHVIPRYQGDMEDPRGGVRHVIPWKGNYLATRPPPLAEGNRQDPFIQHIRPLFSEATEISIVAAFAFVGGLRLLEPSIREAVGRGARVRLIAGDYRNSTPADAFQRMLDWQSEIAALESGRFEPRIIEVDHHQMSSFHPKSWRFEGPTLGAAFVGSSNISHTALLTGVEWNLRLDRGRDPAAWSRLVAAYEQLWQRALPLNAAWIASYRLRTADAPSPEREDEAPSTPLPHAIQLAALAALAATRDEGHRRALVVLATGLGKTLLAAFDVARIGGRTLFIAHRAEILSQAADAFRRVFPSAAFSWCIGAQSELDGEVVFASVQKLTRPEHLERLAGQQFNTVIVDEVHHAAAATYRRVLDALSPSFMLGLTATPDRADEAEILPLFDDNLVYRADLGEGIERQFLVPFRYWGLRDTVDYAPIPWRNGRFDPDQLATALETTARMEQMWTAWQAHPAQRSIVFCSTISHARFVRDWLRGKQVRVEAIYAGHGSADRTTVLDALRDGALDAVCAVDLLNEGVDIPRVDRVVMLRPTESPVVFLQQLGRGLRTAPDKAALDVIDFVGNHRIFLDKMRVLLSLGGQDSSLAAYFAGAPTLPPGCSVDLELEAKEILHKLMPSADGNALVRVFRELRASRGARPTAGELYRMGLNPRSLKVGWFTFCHNEGALDDPEKTTLRLAESWLRELESSIMRSSLPALTLSALLEADALEQGMPLAALSARVRAALERSPELMAELGGQLPEPWQQAWLDRTLSGWTGARFLRVEGDLFVAKLPAAPALVAMTAELVDLRLAQARRRSHPEGAGFVAKVTWNQRDPILKLPREAPRGELDAKLPDGSIWQFRMAKEFCNVARPVGTSANRLPELLRGWFGPRAGHPGTLFTVRFSPSPDGWWVQPDRALSLAPRAPVRSYPDLRAAAGVHGELRLDPEGSTVQLPGHFGPDQFALRAAGDSMDGGKNPIRDGDWVVFRWARGIGPGAVEGQVALVGLGDEHEGVSFHIKRVGRGELCSDNPDVPPIPLGPDARVYALHCQTIPPESLAPAPGTELEEDELAGTFALSAPPPGRVDGHLFLRSAQFQAPDRLAEPVADRGPGETAYILAQLPDGRTRYCGVARWRDGAWAFPAIDYGSWKLLQGRGVSRTLDERWLREARRLAEQTPTGALELHGKTCEVLGRSAEGGLRIRVGAGERTVSLLDLGWVLAADDHARRAGGLLDEVLVNLLRYIEGTPKGSTRWIDTGWAIHVLRCVRG